MTNRLTQPPFKIIEKIDIIEAEKTIFSNQIPFYTINAGEQDVLKIDVLFDAGDWVQNEPLVASLANSMLTEGTKSMDAATIAEKLDYCGAYLQLSSNHHFALVSLSTLSRHLPETIVILEDIIKNSIFPDNEFYTQIAKSEQNFMIEMQKGNVVARNYFLQALYGNDHPYGLMVQSDDFRKITPEHLRTFYMNNYSSSSCTITAAGKLSEANLRLIEKHFGQDKWNRQDKWNNTQVIPKLIPVIKPLEERNLFIEKTESFQTSIRLGKLLVNKTHPDYIGLQILNTVFGGYFSSRLMKNIREEKGYTYDIDSFTVSQKYSGYFSIVSEVNSEFSHQAVAEIYNEMRKLREELVSWDELNLVKSYILGEMVRAFDGPFKLISSLHTLLEYDLDYSYYNRFFDTIKSITPEDIKRLANQYLTEDLMYQVVVGQNIN
jgi:predicted Zn-dependent peptidase